MATTSRTLIVKAVGYKPRRTTPADWQPPRIEDEIRRVMAKGTTVGLRHIPDPAKTIANGSHCLFINSCKDLGAGNGVILTICSYTKGHVPESIAPDMSSAEAKIQAVELKASDGNASELVHTYRCLAYGQVLIVEAVSGGGGVGGLERLLRALVKACSPKEHGLIELSDIASSELHELIASRGGVVKMQARMVHEVGGKTSKFAAKLGDIRSSVKGTNSCVVCWEAKDDDTLDESEAIGLLGEYDSTAIDSVSLHFKLGGSVSDLSQYRERKPVSIQLTPEGRLAVTEVEAALKGYLEELRNPARKGPIKTDGTLKNVKKTGN